MASVPLADGQVTETLGDLQESASTGLSHCPILIVRGLIDNLRLYSTLMKRDADILKQFGERVRALRKTKGFSQEAFAARCGLDRTYIGGIERGERNVALRNIAVIAGALGVSISELMDELDVKA